MVGVAKKYLGNPPQGLAQDPEKVLRKIYISQGR